MVYFVHRTVWQLCPVIRTTLPSWRQGCWLRCCWLCSISGPHVAEAAGLCCIWEQPRERLGIPVCLQQEPRHAEPQGPSMTVSMFHMQVIFLSDICHTPVIIQSYSCHSFVIFVAIPLSYIWHLPVICKSYICHIFVIFLSYSCHNLVIFLLYICHITVILLSYPYHIFVIFCNILVIYLSYICHIPVIFLSLIWSVIFLVCRLYCHILRVLDWALTVLHLWTWCCWSSRSASPPTQQKPVKRLPQQVCQGHCAEPGFLQHLWGSSPVSNWHNGVKRKLQN